MNEQKLMNVLVIWNYVPIFYIISGLQPEIPMNDWHREQVESL